MASSTNKRCMDKRETSGAALPVLRLWHRQPTRGVWTRERLAVQPCLYFVCGIVNQQEVYGQERESSSAALPVLRLWHRHPTRGVWTRERLAVQTSGAGPFIRFLCGIVTQHEVHGQERLAAPPPPPLPSTSSVCIGKQHPEATPTNHEL